MKVLIADEDAAIRDLIVSTAPSAEMQVVSATEGARAWELLSDKDPPRLAVLDWVLLNMNGLEICRRIRQRSSASYTYVILLGARPDKADMVAAFQAGVDDYVRKPLDPDEILGRLRTGCRILEKEERLTGIIRGWRTMLDSLPFGVACLGKRGQLMRANKVFVELLGYEVKSLLGTSLNQNLMRDSVHFSRLLEDIRLNRSFDRTSMEMIQQDGSPRSVVVWGRPIPGAKEMVFQIIISVP